MTDECYYRVSIKGVVIDETGRFLLARKENGVWELLGGGLDHGEDPLAGLRREIREETGLEITYISDSPKYFVAAKRLGHDTFIANVIYEIKLDNLNFIPSDECQELRFFNTEEAQKINVYPSVKQFIDHYDEKLHLN